MFVLAEVSISRSTELPTPMETANKGLPGLTSLNKEHPIMTSNRPKHIEPSSTDPTDGDTTKARALETSRVGHIGTGDHETDSLEY